MRKIAKPISLVLAALTTICLFAACTGDNEENKSKQWSRMNYGDYDVLYDAEKAPEGTEGYWDYWQTKPIKYQFTSDAKNPKARDQHAFSTYFNLLLNLYEDGSVKGWQNTFLIGSMFYAMEGKTEEQSAYNETNQLLYQYYGYWEASGSDVTLYVQNSIDYAVEGDKIQYSKYTFSVTPAQDDNLASFYFNQSENGVAIRSYISCNYNYVGTVKYLNYVSYAKKRNEPDGKLFEAA